MSNFFSDFPGYLVVCKETHSQSSIKVERSLIANYRYTDTLNCMWLLYINLKTWNFCGYLNPNSTHTDWLQSDSLNCPHFHKLIHQFTTYTIIHAASETKSIDHYVGSKVCIRKSTFDLKKPYSNWIIFFDVDQS